MTTRATEIYPCIAAGNPRAAKRVVERIEGSTGRLSSWQCPVDPASQKGRGFRPFLRCPISLFVVFEARQATSQRYCIGLVVGVKESHNNNCFASSAHLAPKKQPKVDKTPDGHIMTSSAIVIIREISKSTGIAPDFQNSLLFSLFSGNLGTASLR
jgi:hypothetical protein